MVFVNGVGKLRDPVTQGDEFSIAQFFVKRLMEVTGDNRLVAGCEEPFGIGFEYLSRRPVVALPAAALFAQETGQDRNALQQDVGQDPDQDTHQAAAEEAAQPAITGIVGVGQVAMGEINFHAVEFDAAAIGEHLTGKPTGEDRAEVEVMIALDVDQLRALLMQPFKASSMALLSFL